MSDTIRTILVGGRAANNGAIAKVDDTRARFWSRGVRNRKMKSYTKKPQQLKYNNEGHNMLRKTGPVARESVRNANRAAKKGLRQQFKKQLQEELELINQQNQ